MFKRITCLVFFSLVCATCGVKPYNQAQYSECFNAYSTAFNACNGSATCEQDALDAYQSCTGDDAKIPLHFIVLTEKLALQLNPTADNSITLNFLKSEVDTLNRYFTVEDSRYPPDNRKKIVSFQFKSATFNDVVTTINDPMVDVAVPELNFDRRHEDFKPTMNSSTDPRLYDPSAVNVYIADCVDSLGTDIVSSHGNNRGNRPYIVLDYARITGLTSRQAAEEHEMGHAFGLGHECDPSASRSSDTNIMASSGNCSGSGGERNIGFTPDQCETILEKVNDFLASIN